MEGGSNKTFLKPISRRLNSFGSTAEALLRPESSSRVMNGEVTDTFYDDVSLAPVMPAIDAVQQLVEQEKRNRLAKEKLQRRKKLNKNTDLNDQNLAGESSKEAEPGPQQVQNKDVLVKKVESNITANSAPANSSAIHQEEESYFEGRDEEVALLVRRDPLSNLINLNLEKKNEEYEFIPKSVILDIYSNDPEVKRFLKQLTKIGTEFGYNEQDYKCYSCRRPIGLVFGQSRLCNYDGHHYCSECHLGEKATIPARVLCNWDFNKYPISKRNQHFLTLISNEPMFELKTMAPLLCDHSQELREIEELRCQAFFIRSYCFTCVQDSISFELTKLVWPREHLIKQTDLYSLEDLIQIKSGSLKQVLKNVISFGRQHVLSCMLCCQKGFICELCKSSQIIYPFDTESVYRCNSCQSIYHKTCFKSKPNTESCPRCQRLKARRKDS